jgi:hypothetical protein
MKSILVLFLCLMAYLLPATILIVSQDGTGHFTAIQDGITASVNGDTVLVYPGTYYENINYSGKNITVASLELTTGNPAYRESTIIDGNNAGSCVMVISHEINASIYGFTIQHGSGWTYIQNGAQVSIGGGIRIRYASDFRIVSCVIKENRATAGGGINILQGTMHLIDTLIYHNYASQIGGGILFEMDSNCNFDYNQRCSIYENHAGAMNDIGASEVGGVIDIVLDTFTVNPPSVYYSNYVYLFSGGYGYFTYDILNAYRAEINHNIYVSPLGNDNNDGLSPENPLKSITKALHSIASDSLNQKTIFLAPGTYDSEDGQIFPLSLKAHVKLVGDSLDYPIILNQYYEETICGGYAPGISVKNLIIEHNNHQPIDVFTLYHSNNAKLSNIIINPVHGLYTSGMTLYQGKYDLEDITLNGLTSNCSSGINFFVSYGSAKNIFINDCHTLGGEDLPEVSIINADLDSTLVLENITISNCSVISPNESMIQVKTNQFSNPYLRLTNLLAYNNTTTANSPFSISLNSNNESVITNCTIVNNVGGSSILKLSGRMNVSNCLISNGGYSEINVRNTQIAGYISNMQFNNNLIEGYPNSVYVHTSNNVDLNEYNFDADPGFAGTDWSNPLSYRLGNDSPCIDAGTPDTTGLYLPEYDLLGNPRIYNGIVDIGCYEWNGTGAGEDVIPIPTDGIVLSLYPNPVYAKGSKGSYSFIEFTLTVKAKQPPIVKIYNLKGQRVRSLTISHSYNDLVRQAGLSKQVSSSGEFYSTVFDCRDERGGKLASGIYLIRIKADGRQASVKMTIIR